VPNDCANVHALVRGLQPNSSFWARPREPGDAHSHLRADGGDEWAPARAERM